MLVTVEDETSPIGPFMSCRPKHWVTVHLIECIASINEKEPPFFFLTVWVVAKALRQNGCHL